jgi:hypothetical protein
MLSDSVLVLYSYRDTQFASETTKMAPAKYKLTLHKSLLHTEYSVQACFVQKKPKPYQFSNFSLFA